MGPFALRSLAAIAAASLVAACATTNSVDRNASRDSRLAAAEALIDAFYSFDPAQLRQQMSAAPSSMPQILYYQGWAEGGHYVVIERKPCRLESTAEVRCEIKVRDDLIAALGTSYDVTDNFHLTFKDGRIGAVRTSSNDPPEFDQALHWLRERRPELMTEPCRGFFAGGPTPGDCVRAVVKGFAEFAASRPR